MPEAFKPERQKNVHHVYQDSESLLVLDRHIQQRKQLGTVLLSRAAEKAGATVQWLNRLTCVASFNNTNLLIRGYIHNQTQVAAKIVGNKFLSKQLLLAAGVPAPKGEIVHSAEDAIRAWRAASRPVVIKPLGSYGGKGLSVDLDGEGEVTEAFVEAAKHGPEVLVEEYVEVIHEYRALATPDECVSVVKRVLPYVIGDGRRSIESLIAEKNETRKTNPSLVGRPIPADTAARKALEKRGYTLASVPPPEERVTVRDIGGLSSGGEAYECLEDVSTDLRETVRKAVASVPGLTWGGCDLLVDQASGRCFVVEVNSTPGITGSMFPTLGQSKDIAALMWERREKDAIATPKATPALVARVPQGVSAGAAFAELGISESRVSLGNFGLAYLGSRGFRVVGYTGGLVQVFRGSESDTGVWFTNELYGPSDLAVSRRVVRRDGNVRALLRRSKVPRVQGREVSTVEEVEAFRKEWGWTPVSLLPTRREWNTSHTKRAKTREVIEPDALNEFSRWIVQLRQPGTRLRVVTSRDRVLCVLGRDDGARLDDDTFQAAGNLAVQAIRAIPELRWGSVDIVVLPAREPSGLPRVLVEGVEASPMLYATQQVLGGSLSEAVAGVSELGVDDHREQDG